MEDENEEDSTPVSCPSCEAPPFPSRASLAAHRRDDCGARAFTCERCGRRFASKKSLTNHVTTSHEQQVVHEKVKLNCRLR